MYLSQIKIHLILLLLKIDDLWSIHWKICILYNMSFVIFNPSSARIFIDIGLRLLEGRVLHKGAWVATLLGTLHGVHDYKKVKFQGRDISSLAAKGLNDCEHCIFIYTISYSFQKTSHVM